MTKKPTPAEPHPLVLLSTSWGWDLSQEISRYVDVPLGKVEDEPFPDGESFVQILDDVRGRDVFIVCPIGRRWEASQNRAYTGINDNLMELMVFCDAAARASAWRITAVIPYFGYARQDRKSASRTPITARVVANMLEGVGINRVLTMDLHAEQIQGFFSPKCLLDHLNAGKLFADYVTAMHLKNAVVLSPDVGNLKKVDKYRQGMPDHFDVAVIDKRRANGKKVESRRLIGDVQGKRVLMMDDMISTAGTMCSGIDFALDHGAKSFIIAATHGIFAPPAWPNFAERRSVIERIVVTNSLPPARAMNEITETYGIPLEYLSIGELFGEAIIRIHQNESISELLGPYG